MTDLAKGANAALHADPAALAVSGAAQGSVDLMIFQLTGERRVRSDDDFVFFNQPSSPEGAVRLTAADRIAVTLSSVPPEVTVLAVAVALDDSVAGGLGERVGLGVTIASGGESITASAGGLTTERAAVLVELYRRDEGWKVRNVSAGWDGGLAALAAEHGVSVEDEPVPPPAPAGAKVDLGKRTGRIDLTKGQRVSIDSSDVIVAAVSWPAETDYDVYALISYADGHTETVSAFGTLENPQFSPTSSDAAVRHLGDIGRAAPKRLTRKERKAQGVAASSEVPIAVERIEIRPHAGLRAIVPVAYSAQSNGAGSFREYRVSMSIDNGHGTSVRIDAANADDDDMIFSCVPGIILVTPSGVVIDSLEQYSAPGSERRPTITPELAVVMDAGETNVFK